MPRTKLERKKKVYPFPLLAVCGRLGVSLEKLSARSGIKRQTLYELANGRRRPSWDSLNRIADALDVGLQVFEVALTPQEVSRE
jgi:transcriptional regulator with XRE-family HTH domain